MRRRAKKYDQMGGQQGINTDPMKEWYLLEMIILIVSRPGGKLKGGDTVERYAVAERRNVFG